ncbi:Protein of unknown function [Gryllus bimaculatus]|nr:Protein of unknown function [Gryllus bimaculatus]
MCDPPRAFLGAVQNPASSNARRGPRGLRGAGSDRPCGLAHGDGVEEGGGPRPSERQRDKVTKEREYALQCFTEVNETIQDVIKDTQSIDCGGEYAVAAGLLKSGELSPDTPPIWPKTYRNLYVQVIYPSCNAYVSAVPMCSKTWTYKKCLKQRMNHRMKSMMSEEVKGLISR